MKRYFSIIAILALAACTKEYVPGGNDASLRTETLNARIAATKVEVSDAGKFSWTEGDEIAVHRSVNGYETAALTADGCFNVHLAEGEARDGYAVYPALIATDDATLSVNLPSAYTIPKAGMGDYSPLPMVAVNDPDSDDLLFHHLGGIIRLVLDTVPFETHRIEVNVGKKVTGTFVVNDPASAEPYISLSEAAAEDIVYTLPSPASSTVDDFVINIPVPLGEYETISVKIYDRYGNKMEEKTESVSISVGRADGYFVDSDMKVDVSVIPLCLKMARNGTVSVDNPQNLTMEYSLDNVTWTSFSGDLSLQLEKGNYIYFRGNNPGYGVDYSNDCTRIRCDSKAYLFGNVMSLITPLPENFSTLKVLTASYAFRDLFYDENANPITPRLLNHPTMDLLLPATTLTPYCYDSMFEMTGLSRIELPATEMQPYCYSNMFEYCKFVTAPKLPATSLAMGCYQYMFEDNNSLVNAPELPVTTLAKYCYRGMFRDCSSLQVAPELPATIMEDSCYEGMFSRTGLLQCPELRSTAMASSCYAYMFSGCNALTAGPVLPAETMAEHCYTGMLQECRSLTDAPQLPAMTLAHECYRSMFYWCTSLTEAPDLPATTLASSCYSCMFEQCTSLTEAPELNATTLADNCYTAMFRECTALTEAPDLPATDLGDNSTNCHCYDSMFADCTALVTAPEIYATTLSGQCFMNMFSGCTALVNAPVLRATTLQYNCYEKMFQGCTSLVNAPVLPALTLKGACYREMFKDCTSLGYVKAMFTDGFLEGNELTGWLSGVPETGTYEMNDAATYDPVSDAGVPSGWTVNRVTE